MNKNLDLKQTERNSFKLATYADGTADLSLGLAFLLLGIYPFTREQLGPVWNFPVFLVVLGLIVFAQYRVKSRLAPTRIGIVKLGQRVQKRFKVALLVMVILLTLTVLTWVGVGRGIHFAPDWWGSYTFEILVALVTLAIFWGIAYTLEMQRYYFYGVLLAACFPLQQILPIYEGVPYLAAGGIITGIGAYLLVRFLEKYPPAEEQGEGA
ncbi:MAG: hypothetical protein WBB69_00525 [Anaerolineales bacterium]